MKTGQMNQCVLFLYIVAHYEQESVVSKLQGDKSGTVYVRMCTSRFSPSLSAFDDMEFGAKQQHSV